MSSRSSALWLMVLALLPVVSWGVARYVVITTVQSPTPAVRAIAALPGWRLIVVGDRKTPADWSVPGVAFLPHADQASAGRYARLCPHDHYARKNLGYLEAMRRGATLIAETDDDNHPLPGYLQNLRLAVTGRSGEGRGWVNIYAWFSASGERLWPRGFPLELVLAPEARHFEDWSEETRKCPVQQFLADGEPDVDAVHRLTVLPREVWFQCRPSLLLGPGSLCPFNSQNTVWWPEAWPLLYLPALANFRMTDIWRSLVAQACLHARGLAVAFHPPSVRQVRNPHDLMADFADEIPGYRLNRALGEQLGGLSLSPEPEELGTNLRRCYAELVSLGCLPGEELELLEAWLADVGEAFSEGKAAGPEPGSSATRT